MEPPAAPPIICEHGRVSYAGQSWRCAIGAGGLVAAAAKREGDGATPTGRFPLRTVLYRPDRITTLHTALPTRALTPTDGWCDAPADPNYNRPVILPYAASTESLWRADAVYDLIGLIGYNDDPPVAGKGSAIFLHIARPDYAPTDGCVALARDDLLQLLALLPAAAYIDIRA